MSSDEPQKFKYNIADVKPLLWSQFKGEGLGNIPLYKAKLITHTCVNEAIPIVT